MPQEAWIQNATLRDNVLFGRACAETRYADVVRACALEPDIRVLAAGDQTEIGEKVRALTHTDAVTHTRARTHTHILSILPWQNGTEI